MRAARNQQSGLVALIIPLLLLLAGGLFLRWQTYRLGDDEPRQFSLARDALIARAATDLSRPGSLPCPDLLTDSSALANHPGDGKADMLVRNDCPSHVGWLPGVTLDLPTLTDAGGATLWYVLASAHRDDDNAPPLNSDTTTSLWLDGDDDVAALLIAPGPAQEGQVRPSLRVADYLEGSNSDGDDGQYSTRAGNDRVYPVRRSELMAAVERRVAGEVFRCLQAQAALPGATQAYPWPSPLSRNDGRGIPGSRFGRLPLTQPSPGSASETAAAADSLRTLQSALNGSLPETELQATLDQLANPLADLGNFYAALYATASRLWQAAGGSDKRITSLAAELDKDLKPNSSGTVSIINSEQTRILNGSNELTAPLAELGQALNDGGIDVFPAELRARLNQLAAAPGSDNTEAIARLAANSASRHDNLGPLLQELQSAASLATQAWAAVASTPGDSAAGNRAAQASTTLHGTGLRLLDNIAPVRTLAHPDSIAPFVGILRARHSALNTASDTKEREDTASTLADLRRQVAAIVSGTASVREARDATVAAVDEAVRSAGDPRLNAAAFGNTLENAAQSLENLVATLRRNDDNLTRSSVTLLSENFRNAQQAFSGFASSDTRARVPYAQNLQSANSRLAFWSNLLLERSQQLAVQMKAAPFVAGDNAASKTATAGSAVALVQGAEQDLQTALSALADFRSGASSARQRALDASVQQLSADISRLLAFSGTAPSTTTSSAAAFPMRWRAAACRSLQEDGNSWWVRNGWRELVFYQISDAYPASPGRLSANGRKQLPLVVIAAGRSRNGQARPSVAIADYLEGGNAHPSRNGDAAFPAPDFSAPRAGAGGNDRLAY